MSGRALRRNGSMRTACSVFGSCAREPDCSTIVILRLAAQLSHGSKVENTESSCFGFFSDRIELQHHIDTGVSLNGGTPISHPKMIIFSRKTHGPVGETHHLGNPHTSTPRIFLQKNWNDPTLQCSTNTLIIFGAITALNLDVPGS